MSGDTENLGHPLPKVSGESAESLCPMFAAAENSIP
jgi:hypothetical protein